MSLFEKDLLDISFWDLLEYLVSKRTRYRLEELLENPCKSRFLKKIKVVKEEDEECRFSTEFGVRIALAALSWIYHLVPEKADEIKRMVSILLEIYSEYG